jgi:hypothetical protein
MAFACIDLKVSTEKWHPSLKPIKKAHEELEI